MCDYGVLPIENSTAGSVKQIYDLMMYYNFYIVRSVRVKVDHNLLAKKGADLAHIKEIYSHEHALAQCTNYINSLGNVKVNVVENTAIAAKLVADSDRTDIAPFRHAPARRFTVWIASHPPSRTREIIIRVLSAYPKIWKFIRERTERV